MDKLYKLYSYMYRYNIKSSNVITIDRTIDHIKIVCIVITCYNYLIRISMMHA